MPKPTNPYIAGNPIKDERGFFGRQDVLTWVSSELHNPGTNALVLFGQRRIGKTSLLLQLRHYLPFDDFLAVYFDLQDTSALSLGRLLANLADRTADQSNLHLPASLEFDNEGRSFQREFLPWLFENIGENRRIVFLLDEFDVLDQTVEAELPAEAASKSLLPFLRRLMNKEPRLAFVFVIGRNPSDLRADFSATFKASLFRQLWVLDTLSAKQLIRLAERNNTLRYENTAIDRILQLTSGHPYLTQLFCQRLWEHFHTEIITKKPTIHAKDVESIIPQVIETGANALDWLWRGLQSTERIYAAALAEIAFENQPVSEKQVLALLSKHTPRLPFREVELAPDDLVERRVIEVSGVSGGERNYRFAVELFRLWVKETQPLERVKDDLDRVDELADQLFKVAYSYYKQGVWQDAFDNFTQALTRNPRHFKAALYLGETLIELRRLPDAIDVFQKAYMLDHEKALQPLARALLESARLKFSNGDTDGALEDCEEALKLSPSNKTAMDLKANILEKLGDTSFEKNDIAFALSAYHKAGANEKINQLKVFKRHEWIAAGENALDRQDMDAAILAYEYAKEFKKAEIIRKNPTLITACHALAELYRERRELEQAKKYLYKIIGLEPENAINSLFTLIREQINVFKNRADKLNSSDNEEILGLYQEIVELQSLAEINLHLSDEAKFKKLGNKKQSWDDERRKNLILKSEEFMNLEDYRLLSEFVNALQDELNRKLESINTTPESKLSKVVENNSYSKSKDLSLPVGRILSNNIVKIENTDTQLNIHYLNEKICLAKVEPGKVLVGEGTNQLNAVQSVINLNYTYWIGIYPITNQQFALFEPVHNFEKSDSLKPVTKISWPIAMRFCEWLERELYRYTRKNEYIVRLPDEVEWERAAKGDSKNTYPWGNESVNDTLCNYGNKLGGVTAVGEYSPLGNSPFGCSDMAGNVWEWTVSPFDEGKILHPGDDFNKKFAKRLVCKGGSWSFPEQFTKCSSRYKFLPNSIHEYIGFRILIKRRA